jgi:hypothetical protein
MRAVRIGDFVLVSLVSCAASQAPAVVEDAAAVVAAEREFAADGAARGWAAAFRRYHAPEAIVLQPDPVKAAGIDVWRRGNFAVDAQFHVTSVALRGLWVNSPTMRAGLTWH